MLRLQLDTEEESVVYRLAFAPTGDRLLALVDAGWEHDQLSELHEWSLPEARERRVSFVRWGGVFAPDLRWVASVGYQHTAGVHFPVVHDLSATPTRHPPPTAELVRALGFEPHRIFSRLWEYPGVTFDPCCLGGGLGSTLTVSADGRLVAGRATVYDDENLHPPDELRVWEVESGASRGVRVPAPIDALAFSPDGRRLVGVRPGALDLWDVDTLTRRTWRRQATPAGPLRFSPDGTLLAAATPDAVVLLDVGDGTTAPAVRARWPVAAADLAFHPGGRLLAAGRDGLARVWDPSSGREAAAFDWSAGPLRSVCFAPDGLTCAAGGEKGKVVIWDVDA